jgi:ABC-type antimicrobial peptide transport system permease subunit
VDAEVLAAWSTYAWAPLLLIATSLAAAIIPGIRASRVDPVIALRAD